MCICFVIADLYERTTTDNDPDFGEMDDMGSFACLGRDSLLVKYL